MSRQPISSPLSVLLAGVIVIVLLLAGTGANTSALTRQQASTPTWTPCPDDDEESSFDCLDFRDELTATAEAATAAYPYPSPGTPTATTRVGSATPTATTRVGSTTPGGSPTSTRGASNPTSQATPTRASSDDRATATSALPSPTPTPADTLLCVPGSPVPITGRGPAHAPLLLFFNQRAVGGGSAAADGSFALTLVVGQERPGSYQVVVRVRGSSQVVRQLTCTISAVAPTAPPLASR